MKLTDRIKAFLENLTSKPAEEVAPEFVIESMSTPEDMQNGIIRTRVLMRTDSPMVRRLLDNGFTIGEDGQLRPPPCTCGQCPSALN